MLCVITAPAGELAPVDEHGQLYRARCSLVLLRTFGSGLGTALPPPALAPNPGRGEGRILPHTPHPPADLPFLTASVGVPCAARVCPLPADPAPPPVRVLQGCWEAVSEQRGLLNLAEGGRENADRGHIAGPASPPLALPDRFGCWGPPTPAPAEHAMSLGSN